MGRRLDIIHSLLEDSAERARNFGPLKTINKLRRLNLSEIKERITQFGERETRISESEITARVIRGKIDSVMCAARDGRLVFTADKAGESFEVVLKPPTAFFAPRGPKELLWEVEATKTASVALCRDIVAYVTSFVADGIWGFLIEGNEGDIPLVDHVRAAKKSTDERAHFQFRCDLRTLPEVRKFETSPMALMLEVFRLQSVRFDEGAMWVKSAVNTGQ